VRAQLDAQSSRRGTALAAQIPTSTTLARPHRSRAGTETSVPADKSSKNKFKRLRGFVAKKTKELSKKISKTTTDNNGNAPSNAPRRDSVLALQRGNSGRVFERESI
jgi:hypothetical protein